MDIQNPIVRRKLSDEIIQSITKALNYLNNFRDFLEQRAPDLHAQFTERVDNALNGIDRDAWTYEAYKFTDDEMNMLRGIEDAISDMEEHLSTIQRHLG